LTVFVNCSEQFAETATKQASDSCAASMLLNHYRSPALAAVASAAFGLETDPAAFVEHFRELGPILILRKASVPRSAVIDGIPRLIFRLLQCLHALPGSPALSNTEAAEFRRGSLSRVANLNAANAEQAAASLAASAVPW